MHGGDIFFGGGKLHAARPAPTPFVQIGKQQLLAEVVPHLTAEHGIVVELLGDQPALQQATEDPLISLTVTDGTGGRDGNDWFDLDVEVSVGSSSETITAQVLDGSIPDYAHLVPTGGASDPAADPTDGMTDPAAEEGAEAGTAVEG